MAKIGSPAELRQWLDDKQPEFAQIIAARLALRVLPVALDDKAIAGNSRWTIALFRATAISWAARSWPAHDMGDAAAYAAAYAAADAAYAADAAAYAAARAAADAADAAYAAYAAARAAAARAAAARAAAARAAADAAADAAAFWESIAQDIQWLEGREDDPRNAARVLAGRSLWLGQPPKEFTRLWGAVQGRLRDADPDFTVWIDWYQRRLRGEGPAFDIPGDRYRKEDKAVLRQLADATDEDFWGKGAEYVNAELARWLKDARARAAKQAQQRKDNTDRLLEELPRQSPNALNFGQGDSGKITIEAGRGDDALRADPDSRDRHQSAMDAARDLLTRCATSNAGARLTQMLENYIAAGGDTLEMMRPSLMVQRGEKIRQEITAYEAADSMLPPIADDILVDLKSWRSAHNMHIGLQPRLNALDTAQLGPDAQPALFPPDDLRNLARDAQQAELLEDGVEEILEETADLAPDIPDPNDRRTIWSVETGKNLIIETFAMVMNNPGKAIGSALAAGFILTEPVTASIAALGAVPFLMRHQQWIETSLGNSPTWQSLFASLCELIEKHTPLSCEDEDSSDHRK